MNNSVILRKVAFKGHVRFDDTGLPVAPTGDCKDSSTKERLVLDEVSFEKGLFISSKQFFRSAPWWAFWTEDQPVFDLPNEEVDTDQDSADLPPDYGTRPSRATPEERLQWREFERGFRNAGDLGLQNYAMYRLSRLEAVGKKGLDLVEDTADWWFWGYGLRPWRVAGWLMLLIFVFALIYVGQTFGLGEGRSLLSRWLARIRFAVIFSVRTTLKPTFGYDHSRTLLFKTISTLQWLLSVILLTCLLYSFSKTSPLANELIKKLAG